MPTESLSELPPPPAGKRGWPWTGGGADWPAVMPDGRPWPRISVVTPSFNQGPFIEETIRSVLLQGYPDLEYIIVDGGSTDNSVEIIKKYEPWLTHWVSEPDRGQVHAINKGLALSTGDIFNWVNSDDLLLPGALTTVAQAFDQHTDAVAGTVVNFTQDGAKTLIANTELDPISMIRGEPGTVYHQPGVWLRRTGILRCGGMEEQFDYAFDWDMMIRYLAFHPRVVYTSAPLAQFRLHAHSKTVSAADKYYPERVRILQNLLAQPQFESLHPACDRRLRHIRWWETLDRLARDDSVPFWVRAFNIVRAACKDPGVRLSRLTFGTIRRSCLPAGHETS